MSGKDTKKSEAAAVAEAVEESKAAAAEQDKADAVKAKAEKPAEVTDKWFHDVDHDSNSARSAAQHARDTAAGAPDTRESNAKSRPGLRQ